MELLRDGSQNGQIHAADQFGMVSGQRVEGTVAQYDAATSAVWFVPVLRQCLTGAGEKPIGAWSRAGGCPGLIGDATPPTGARGSHGIGRGGALRGSILEGGGQQLSREVVSTFRQDHRKLSTGSCVHLGGTAGAGASTLGEAA